jgi:micrococcal nuclease
MGCNWSSIQQTVDTFIASQQQQQPTGGAVAHVGDAAAPTSSAGIIYPELPKGAEKQTVRNVYDGDTLTLMDERRVRFLGIDTPEVKQQQAFAQEAKAYTKNLCDKKDVYLEFESNGDKKDHYGRLLAYVWVKAEGGYLCVNEGIVAAGLARVYLPNNHAKLSHLDKMISLQNEARSAHRGLWSTFKDYDVVKTANGSAYHKRGCEHLSRSHNLTQLKVSEAVEKGLHPCRTCLADA